jgi:hypothetical protein
MIADRFPFEGPALANKGGDPLREANRQAQKEIRDELDGMSDNERWSNTICVRVERGRQIGAENRKAQDTGQDGIAAITASSQCNGNEPHRRDAARNSVVKAHGIHTRQEATELSQ